MTMETIEWRDAAHERPDCMRPVLVQLVDAAYPCIGGYERQRNRWLVYEGPAQSAERVGVMAWAPMPRGLQ